MMEQKYFKTKSKTLAYALNYLGYSFFKFQDDEDRTYYSFIKTDKLLKDLKKLEDIKYDK